MKAAFALLLIFVAVASAQQHSELVGKWSDDSHYGGFLFICQNEDPTTISGMYSETGIIQGDLDSTWRRATGQFWEARTGDCITGTFDLVLDTDSNSFHGFYICADDADQVRRTWDEERDDDDQGSDPETPSDMECARMATSGDFDGHFETGDGLVFSANCFSVANQAYTVSLSAGGYDRGDAFTVGDAIVPTVFQGAYTTATGSAGSSLWFIAADGNLANVRWEGYTVDLSRADNIHTYHIFSATDDTSLECDTNARVATHTWEGVWTDDIFGGDLHMCVSDNQVSGIYTEAGILVGFPGGIAADDVDYFLTDEEYYNLVENPFINGSFYEGGEPNIDCRSGSFQWRMADDGMSFDGCYACFDDDDGCVHEWNGRRTSRDRPADLTCGRLQPTYEDFKTTGVWSTNGAEVDFCIDDDDFESSTERDDGTNPVYSRGNGSQDERIAYGGAFFENRLPGSSLWFLSWSGDLVEFIWTETPHPSDINDGSKHSIGIFSDRRDETPNCDKNDELAPPLISVGDIFLSPGSPADSSSDASVLAVGLVALLALGAVF